MAEPATHQSEKQEVEHLEETREDVDHQLDYGHVKSRWDELSIRRTLWVFRRVVLVSIAVYTGYICEGFEVSERPHLPCIGGSAVALTVLGCVRHSSILQALSSQTLALSSSLVTARKA
jgi:hypothetical protein